MGRLALGRGWLFCFSHLDPSGFLFLSAPTKLNSFFVSKNLETGMKTKPGAWSRAKQQKIHTKLQELIASAKVFGKCPMFVLHRILFQVSPSLHRYLLQPCISAWASPLKEILISLQLDRNKLFHSWTPNSKAPGWKTSLGFGCKGHYINKFWGKYELCVHQNLLHLENGCTFIETAILGSSPSSKIVSHTIWL